MGRVRSALHAAPLGPVHDVADQLGAAAVGAPARPGSHTRSSPPSSTASGFNRPSSSSTTSTGPTRARSTCSASCCAASGSTRSLVIGTLRDDEIGPDPPAALAPRRRRPLGRRDRRWRCARSASRAIADAGRGPLRRPRLAPPHHGRQPVLRRRDARPRRWRPSHAPCATPSSPARPISTPKPGICSTSWPVRPRRSPITSSPASASGCSRCAPLDDAGLIRRGPAASPSATTCAACAIAEHHPAGRRGGPPPPHARRARVLTACGPRRARPTTRSAPATASAYAPPRLRRRSRRGPVGCAHAGRRRSSSIALEHGVALAPVEEAELLELLADEYYLIDRLDDAIAASERAMRLRGSGGRSGRGQRQPPRPVRVPLVQRQPERRRAPRRRSRRRARRATTSTRSATELAGLGHALAMQAYLAMQANDLDQARRAGRPTPSRWRPAPTSRCSRCGSRLLGSICGVHRGRTRLPATRRCRSSERSTTTPSTRSTRAATAT